ncbi:hypothetical protein CTAYLR_000179, partial [Chrysophaeum taylorii]
SETAREALADLRKALPYDAAVCAKVSKESAAGRVACAEREFVALASSWFEWHAGFRASSDCARWCGQVAEDESRAAFVVQGHKRLRKGYGNHAFATLNALIGAILTNRSVVLGLDEATRELNTPHLLWDDEAAWTVRSLRARYLSCGCRLVGPPGRRNAPLWHSQKQISHLLGLAPSDRWPLSVDPSAGLGLVAAAGAFFRRDSHRFEFAGSDCRSHGDHFLKESFAELSASPNLYGILAYAFARPTDDLGRFVERVVANRTTFDIGAHVRVNLHVGTTTHGANFLKPKEKAWRLDPLAEEWTSKLAREQLPRLRTALSADRILVVSDQPAVAAGIAQKAEATSFFDAVSAADDAMRRATAAENDGRFMIRSADWGSSPRWASLADLFLLSTANKAIACAGPYSPSTFCELAAALAAVRRALSERATPAAPTWQVGTTAPLWSSLFWCPELGSDKRLGPPACCEAAVVYPRRLPVG